MDLDFFCIIMEWIYIFGILLDGKMDLVFWDYFGRGDGSRFFGLF